MRCPQATETKIEGKGRPSSRISEFTRKAVGNREFELVENQMIESSLMLAAEPQARYIIFNKRAKFTSRGNQRKSIGVDGNLTAALKEIRKEITKNDEKKKQYITNIMDSIAVSRLSRQ